MFVASYARLPSITVRDTTSVPLHYGSGPSLQCAVQCASVPLRPSVTMRGTASVPLGPSITMRGTASVPLGPSITMRGTASVPLGPSITMRGTASVPLGPSITMRGTASVPLRYRSGPLLQCAVPPRYRFGTARALYYNARYRHPVWVLQSFNWIGVRNFQENTKTNRKATKRNLNIVVPALLQTGRSTLAPRHSKCTSRSTILFGWSVACRLLV